MMQTLAQYHNRGGPTGWDHNNYIGSHDYDNWLIVVGQNRDSSVLEQSNFASALDMLGGESDTVQIHRFGHWACGWFELILVDPADSEAVNVGQEIENALESYPVLDESDLSEREHEDAQESWESWGANDFRKRLVEVWLADCPEEQYDRLHDDLIDALDEVSVGKLWDVYREADGFYEFDSGGCYFDLDVAECIAPEEVIPDFIANIKRERMADLRCNGDFLGEAARWFWDDSVEFCLWE